MAEVGVSGSPRGEEMCPEAAAPLGAEASEWSGRRRSAVVPRRCAQRGHSEGHCRRC